jgi:hypothetical protein
MFVGKIATLLPLAFCGNIFAQSVRDNERHYARADYVVSCDDTLNVKAKEIKPRRTLEDALNEASDFDFSCDLSRLLSENKRICKKEITSIDTWGDPKRKVIKKTITCKNFEEKIVEIYDKKNNLLFSKHYKWKDKMLIRTIDDGVVRNIIPGKTPCRFTIVEPSGDSIYFKLNPKKLINGSIKNSDNFFSFINGYNILLGNYDRRYSNRKYGEHDAIIYHWHSLCKKYPGSEILAEANDSDKNQEERPDVSIKNNDSSSPYKYYAMVAVCVVVVSVVVVRRKRNGGK